MRACWCLITSCKKWRETCNFWPFVWFSRFVFQQLGVHFQVGNHLESMEKPEWRTCRCCTINWPMHVIHLDSYWWHPQVDRMPPEMATLEQVGTLVSPHKQNLGQLGMKHEFFIAHGVPFQINIDFLLHPIKREGIPKFPNFNKHGDFYFGSKFQSTTPKIIGDELTLALGETTGNQATYATSD